MNNNYTLNIAPTDCGNSGCHLTTWQQTNNPTHSTAGAAFAVANAATCRDTTVDWSGAHVQPLPSRALPNRNAHHHALRQCHVNNNYNLTIQPTDCVTGRAI